MTVAIHDAFRFITTSGTGVGEVDSTLTAPNAGGTLTLAAGFGITLVADPINHKITIMNSGNGTGALTTVTDQDAAGTYYPIFTRGPAPGDINPLTSTYQMDTMYLDQTTTPMTYNPNTGTLTLSNIGVTTNLTTSTALIGTQANFTRFPNAQVVISKVVTNQQNEGHNIGIMAEAVANASNSAIYGIGVYGAGYTNSGTRSGGVVGEGHVTATGDAGSAIGVRGYALDTHAGGLNVGLYGDAANGSSNYALALNNGNILSNFALSWTLNGNLTFSGAYTVIVPTLNLTNALGVSYGGTGTGTAGITAFNNISGYTASGATGTTSTNLVFSTSPTLTSPTILTSALFGPSASANLTRFPGAQVAVSSVAAGIQQNEAGNIGIISEVVGTGSNRNAGVYGVGYTSGANNATGVVGEGHVSATGDATSSVGVRGYATDTHSGGLNVGLYGNASGSSTGNYALYMGGGDVYNNGGATTWTITGNLTFSGGFIVTVPTLNLTNALGVAYGGTGITTAPALGSMVYGASTTAQGYLAGNTTTVPQFVTSTGTGSAAQSPTLTTSTGTGSVVLGTNPTITAPTSGNSTSTTDADATVDASTTEFYSYIQSASGTARTINISNLTVGRKITLYVRNTNVATKVINITASTTTSGFTAVNLSNGAGGVSLTLTTLAAVSGTATIVVFNAGGVLGGGII